MTATVPDTQQTDDTTEANRTPAVLHRRRVTGLVIAVAALAVLMVLSLIVGSGHFPVSSAWRALFDYDGSTDQQLIRGLRIPRTLMALLVGAALGISGVLMQALTRNPLADPGLLGINAGAALAVVCGITFGGITSLSGYVWFALAGAFVTTLVVYTLGSIGSAGASPVRLALAGAAIGAVLTGMISVIVLTDTEAFGGYRAWTVGTLTGRTAAMAWQILPFIAVGLIVALCMPGALNALALGDEVARALGVKVGRIRLVGVAATSLLCGAATAAVGPIAFVGLVIPHIARAITGPDYRWLLPYSMLLGPILLLGSDILGRVLGNPGEIQVSVVTAFVGAPVFVALVRRRRLAQL